MMTVPPALVWCCCSTGRSPATDLYYLWTLSGGVSSSARRIAVFWCLRTPSGCASRYFFRLISANFSRFFCLYLLFCSRMTSGCFLRYLLFCFRKISGCFSRTFSFAPVVSVSLPLTPWGGPFLPFHPLPLFSTRSRRHRDLKKWSDRLNPLFLFSSVILKTD